jgi:hypothetical protein
MNVKGDTECGNSSSIERAGTRRHGCILGARSSLVVCDIERAVHRIRAALAL